MYMLRSLHMHVSVCGCVSICRYSLLWVFKYIYKFFKISNRVYIHFWSRGAGENRDGDWEWVRRGRYKQNGKRGSYFCCSL